MKTLNLEQIKTLDPIDVEAINVKFIDGEYPVSMAALNWFESLVDVIEENFEEIQKYPASLIRY